MQKFRNSPARRYNLARNVLLFVIIMTVINCLLWLTDTDTYYICSVFLAYVLFDTSAFGILAPLVILGIYAAAYILSKRRGGWLVAAMVLYILDTLVVLLYMYLLRSEAEAAVGLGSDLLFHIVLVVLLILGVKNRKVGTMSDEELLSSGTGAGAVAAALEGDSDALGKSPEVECTVSVAEEGKRAPLQRQGVLRFEPNQAVIGAQSTAGAVLVGVLLAPMKEIARFGYGEIVGMEIKRKRTITAVLRLRDGRTVTMTFPRKNGERFLSLMAAKGVIARESEV